MKHFTVELNDKFKTVQQLNYVQVKLVTNDIWKAINISTDVMKKVVIKSRQMYIRFVDFFSLFSSIELEE